MFHLLKLCTVGLLLGILSSALVTADLAAAERELIFTHILHRHGARMPSDKPFRKQFCYNVPCGQLTKNGVTMMRTVGKFFSNRYSTTPNLLFTPANDSVKMPQYSLKYVYSRSTDVDRTIQSAIAFLSSFFEYNKAFVPAVHTVPKSMDTLLLTYLQPNLGYYYLFYRAHLLKMVDNVTDTVFPKWKELQATAWEIGLEDACQTKPNRTECAFLLHDIATSMNSEGTIEKFPRLKKNYEKINTIYRKLLHYESYFDLNDKERKRQGSRGYIFWQQVLKNIKDKIDGKMEYKMIHYSAHDITLTPISGSLFDESDNGMLPPYAQTLAVELLREVGKASTTIPARNATPEDNKSEVKYYVRVIRGNPGQTPETQNQFYLEDTKTGLRLKCMNSLGQMYDAQQNTCPLEDFERMLEAGAPTDPRGSCLLEKELEKIVNCPENPIHISTLEKNVSEIVAVPEICAEYRKRCAEVACMSEKNVSYILDLNTLLCVDNSVIRVVEKRVLGNVMIAVISVILFFVGLVVALMIGIKCLSPKQEKADETLGL